MDILAACLIKSFITSGVLCLYYQAALRNKKFHSYNRFYLLLSIIITQKHTYDKLFAQMVFCTFWMNPFYWLIQRELNTIHEFIADAASVENGDTESFAKMLLHSHNEGSYLSPSHSFFNSSIKRRLNMIGLSNKTQYSYLRKILVLPITLIVLAVLSVNVKAQTDTKTNFQTAKEIQKPSEDTIPKSTSTPSRRNLEPITVTGNKTDKKPGLEPITVIGKKSDNNSGLDPITVVGYKSGKNLSLKPITVTGQKSGKNPGLEPITVIGQKLLQKNKQ